MPSCSATVPTSPKSAAWRWVPARFSDTGADVAGYVPGGASTADQNAIEATQSTRGAVAVGNPDAETGVYRQITGVAAGTADSDAANVAQLKSVETIAKTGWKLTTDSGSIDGIGPGDQLVLKGGDGNIVISNQILSNDVSINLADEIEVNRVTARDPDTGASTVLDENGLSFTTQDANGPPRNTRSAAPTTAMSATRWRRWAARPVPAGASRRRVRTRPMSRRARRWIFAAATAISSSARRRPATP
ncbi:hypothetical protein [Sinorhizobium meliloti]|nr:hypothetical protein CN122_05335 [Sinorhizobium meliloti]